MRNSPPPLPVMARVRAGWAARLLLCSRSRLSTAPDLRRLDAEWCRVLDLAHGVLTVAQARKDLRALVADVRRRGSPLVRPQQKELRAAAASALVTLREDRYELDGVRLVLIPARIASVGDEHVVTASSYVRVSLDPLATARGSNVVDIAARRAQGVARAG